MISVCAGKCWLVEEGVQGVENGAKTCQEVLVENKSCHIWGLLYIVQKMYAQHLGLRRHLSGLLLGFFGPILGLPSFSLSLARVVPSLTSRHRPPPWLLFYPIIDHIGPILGISSPHLVLSGTLPKLPRSSFVPLDLSSTSFALFSTSFSLSLTSLAPFLDHLYHLINLFGPLLGLSNPLIDLSRPPPQPSWPPP